MRSQSKPPVRWWTGIVLALGLVTILEPRIAPLLAIGAALSVHAVFRRLEAVWKERDFALGDREQAQQVADLHLRTIQALAVAIEAKDQVTPLHLSRVSLFALDLARELKLPHAEVEALKAGALLHDIGKLAVPEHILSKPGSLSAEEFEKMKIHTVVGAEIVESVGFPYPVAPIVRSHHEHWDGSGYPDKLRAEAIPVGARILAVVDVIDSLASPREYRPARPMKEALSYVVRESGRRFDPRVVEAMVRRMPALEAKLSAQAVPPSGVMARGEFVGRIGAARNEAQVLFEISQAVGTTLRLDAALSAFSSGIRKLVPFHSAALYIISDNVVRAECAIGDEAGLFAALEIPLGEGLSGWVAEKGQALLNGNPSVEPAYGADPSRFSNLRSALVVPLPGDEGTTGVIALYSQAKEGFTQDHLRVVRAAAGTLGATIDNVRRYREAEDSAGIDFLTELPNARALSLHLDRELARCARNGEPLAVMVGDLDGFKQVNDQLGHLAGNQLLQRVATALRVQCRESDFVARLGGDEFAVVLSGLPLLAAPEAVERFTAAVDDVARAFEGAHFISLSLGIARLGMDGNSSEELLEAADRRMYESKTRRKQARRAESIRQLEAPAETVKPAVNE